MEQQNKRKTFVKIFENTAIKMITALAVTGAVSGAVLVGIYTYSMPKIEENIKKETKKAIDSIFPGAGSVKELRKEKVFEVIDSKGSLLGYAFIAEGNGYQGTIKMLAGIDKDLVLLKGMEVLESSETPGLGAEITNDPFKGQFKELSVKKPIEYVKNEKPDQPYEIEAITGATISSRTVVNALNASITELKEILKD